MIKFVAQFSHGNLATLCHFAHVSCDDSLRILLEEVPEDFHVKVDSVPEVASLLALKIWISTSPLYLTVTAPVSSVGGF